MCALCSGLLKRRRHVPARPSSSSCPTTALRPARTRRWLPGASLAVHNTQSLFNRLKILHDENGSFVDRTSNSNFATHKLTATADGVGTFIVVQDVDNALPSISGHITDTLGHDVKGVVLTLAGPDVQSTTSDAAGNYSLVNLALGSPYTVIPLTSDFSLTPASSSFGALGGSQTVNFILNLPTVGFESEDNPVAENGGVTTVTVLRGGDAIGTDTVDYATSNGSAVAGTDYTATSGTLTFGDGVTSQTITIPIVDNSLLDGSRTINLTLSNPSNNLSITNNPVTLVITDDEGAAPTVTGPNRIVQLGNISVTYAAVTLAGTTFASPIDPNSVGSAPNGYTIVGPAYEIATSASYTAPVNVCISLPAITDPDVFARLRILHGEPDAGNQIVLVDRTSGQQFSSRTVCAQVSSLSPFVIARTQTPTAAPATIRGRITSNDGAPVAGATMRLSGGQSGITVTDNQGRYTFANLATGTLYSVTPSLANYTFAPSSRSFSLVGNRTDAGFTAVPDEVPTLNPLDSDTFFVRQHYIDFLGREPDAGGLTFWTDQIAQCGANSSCLRSKRIDVSNAFFFEQEYQQTGAFVFRIYRASFGNMQPAPNPDPSNSVEAARLPAYAVFAPDRAQVVSGAKLASSQLDFANKFVVRPEFLNKYPAGLSGPEFVDAVLATITNNSGADLNAQRAALIDLFNSGGRGNVIYRLADDNVQTNPINNRAFIDAEYNRGFVFTEYSGYLRRDADIDGFLFWLGRVNSAPLRDLSRQHAMVCSFITSAEYQRRFSAVVTHSDGECGP
jgi:Calx-beta domain/Carboxypeptidase regulatory-like domain